jgi:murein DD-endopeptidase MepM/ murein hydrolase activator NlpD
MGLGAMSSGHAQTGQISPAAVEEERLLGSNDEDARYRDLLPFTRTHTTRGMVEGSLTEAAASAGVPAAAMLDVARAFDTAQDRPVPQDGDAFYVRWEQTYAAEGQAIGTGRVLWAEVDPAEGGRAISIHRFRPREGGEKFFLASGEAATQPEMALPVDDIVVSSRFGLRADPLSSRSVSGGAAAGIGPLPKRSRTHAHAHRTPAKGAPGKSNVRHAPRPFAGFAPPPTFMHHGVDFAVPQGTPIYAPTDGVIASAGRYGGYGNYIRIEHGDGLATAYGHLSRFVPNVRKGTRVSRGQLVGYTGNTGRSTGPHLHFEVLTDGKTVDPFAYAGVAQLGGPDLERFIQQVSASQRERARETEAQTNEAAAVEEPTAAE